MPGNHPTHRPPAGGLLLALLLVGFLIPAVSAEMLVEHNTNNLNYDSSVQTYQTVPATPFYIKVLRVQDYPYLSYVYSKFAIHGDARSILEANPYYSSPVTLKIGTDVVGYGTAYYNALYNTAGSITHCQCWVEIDEYDVSDYIGANTITLVPEEGTLFNQFTAYFGGVVGESMPIGFHLTAGTHSGLVTGTHIIHSSYDWYNDITYDDDTVYLTRNIAGVNYPSTLTVVSAVGTISDTQPLDIQMPYIGDGNWTVTSPWGGVYTGPLSSEPIVPEQSGTLNLYVQNSQTGALISGARAVISAGFYDPADLVEVSNTTLASGTKTYTLQPTGGGLPNPDYYRIFVTADGYNAELPYVDTELEAGLSITMILGMEPTAGAPEDENETYVEFYVRDINANPLSNAVVKCGGYTLMTNSAGFTQFDLPKNATYQYTVRKTGYTAIEGTVTVGANSRYPVNIVLGVGTIPTYTPTPGPGVPGATLTPDTRSPAEKAASGLDYLLDNAENFGIMAGMILLIYMSFWMVPKRR